MQTTMQFKHWNWLKKYGIQYLVRDRSLAGISEEDFDLLPARLEKFKDHPALLGHLAIDEPGPWVSLFS